MRARIYTKTLLAVGVIAAAGTPAVAQTTSVTVKLPPWEATCATAGARCGAQQAVTAAILRLTLDAPAAGATIRVEGPHSGGTPTDFTATGQLDVGVDTDSDPDRTDTAFVVFPDPGATGIDAQRVQVFILPTTDFAGSTCQPETGVTAGGDWTISVGSGGPNIEAGCLLSFDQATTGACSNKSRLIDDAPYGSLVGAPDSVVQGCEADRPGLALMLVLDRSCSMRSGLGTGSSNTKIEQLRKSVAELVTTWETLRGTEAMTCPVDTTGVCPTGRRCTGVAGVADPGCLPTGWTCVGDTCSPDDQLGVAFFDGNAKTMSQIWSGAGSAWSGYTTYALQGFDAIRGDLEASDLANVNASGSTSIGDGIAEGVTVLGGATGRRKAMIVMSDGKQNSPRMVEIVDKSSGTVIVPSSLSAPIDEAGYDVRLTGGGGDVLVSEDIQLYTVTVGTGTQVDADINQAMAWATGAFYLNVTDDVSHLPTLFELALQNLLRFNTYQSMLWRRAPLVQGGGFTTTLPVTSTSRALEVTVLLPTGNRNVVTAALTSPSGRKIAREGRESLRIPVPRPEAGAWKLEVNAAQGAVISDVSAVADDSFVHADLEVVPVDYAPGDEVVLKATLRDGTSPLLGVGSGSGDRIRVRVGKPGSSLGELLSSVSFTPTVDPDDPLSPAESKLQNLLAACSGDKEQLRRLREIGQQLGEICKVLLAQTEAPVELKDDGTGKDDKKDDGIYTGSFRADLVGHYRVFFEIQGTSKSGGPFMREHIESVHVRSVPSTDPADLQMTSSTSGGARAVTFKPLTPTKKLMGPGFANHFLLRSADGAKIFDVVDNLDGSYSATIPSVAGRYPDVELYFLRTFAKLGEDRGRILAQLPKAKLEPLERIKGGCSCAHQGGTPAGAGGGGAFVLLLFGLRRLGRQRR